MSQEKVTYNIYKRQIEKSVPKQHLASIPLSEWIRVRDSRGLDDNTLNTFFVIQLGLVLFVKQCTGPIKIVVSNCDQ